VHIDSKIAHIVHTLLAKYLPSTFTPWTSSANKKVWWRR